MLLTAAGYGQLATLSDRAQQIVGLLLWQNDPEREVIVSRQAFYARLGYRPDNTNMMAIQEQVAVIAAEVRTVLPHFQIWVGDNDLGEQEQLFTLRY